MLRGGGAGFLSHQAGPDLLLHHHGRASEARRRQSRGGVKKSMGKRRLWLYACPLSLTLSFMRVPSRQLLPAWNPTGGDSCFDLPPMSLPALAPFPLLLALVSSVPSLPPLTKPGQCRLLSYGRCRQQVQRQRWWLETRRRSAGARSEARDARRTLQEGRSEAGVGMGRWCGGTGQRGTCGLPAPELAMTGIETDAFICLMRAMSNPLF
eukprot:766575-Hanusia_phi.AAC.1